MNYVKRRTQKMMVSGIWQEESRTKKVINVFQSYLTEKIVYSTSLKRKTFTNIYKPDSVTLEHLKKIWGRIKVWKILVSIL